MKSGMAVYSFVSLINDYSNLGFKVLLINSAYEAGLNNEQKTNYIIAIILACLALTSRFGLMYTTIMGLRN